MNKINKKRVGIFITSFAIVLSSCSYKLIKKPISSVSKINIIDEIDLVKPNYDFEDYYIDSYNNDLSRNTKINHVKNINIKQSLKSKVNQFINSLYNKLGKDNNYKENDIDNYVDEFNDNYVELKSEFAKNSVVNNIKNLEFNYNNINQSDICNFDLTSNNFLVNINIDKITNINSDINYILKKIQEKIFIDETKTFTDKYNINFSSFLSYNLYCDELDNYQKKFYDLFQLSLLFNNKYDENTIKNIVLNQDVDTLLNLLNLPEKEEKNLIISLNILYGNNSIRNMLNNNIISIDQKNEINSDALISLCKIFYKNLINYNEEQKLSKEDFYYSKELFNTMLLDLACYDGTYSEEFILKYNQILYEIKSYMTNKYNLEDDSFVLLKNSVTLTNIEKYKLGDEYKKFYPIILLANLDFYKRSFYKNVLTKKYINYNNVDTWNLDSTQNFNQFQKKLVNKIEV